MKLSIHINLRKSNMQDSYGAVFMVSSSRVCMTLFLKKKWKNLNVIFFRSSLL